MIVGYMALAWWSIDLPSQRSCRHYMHQVFDAFADQTRIYSLEVVVVGLCLYICFVLLMGLKYVGRK